MKIKDLFKKYLKWYKDDVVAPRVENKEEGYNWVYYQLKYYKDLKVADYQEFFDRKQHNDKYETRYKETSPKAKKPYGWTQTEINLIYSFHKCFAMRNQTRLQAYRNDLSQKGKRTKNTIYASLGKFEHLKEKAEDPP